MLTWLWEQPPKCQDVIPGFVYHFRFSDQFLYKFIPLSPPSVSLLSFFALVFMCWSPAYHSGYELSRHDLLLLSRGVQDEIGQCSSPTVDSLRYNAIINSSIGHKLRLKIWCDVYFLWMFSKAKRRKKKCFWHQKALKVYKYFSVGDDK